MPDMFAIGLPPAMPAHPNSCPWNAQVNFTCTQLDQLAGLVKVRFKPDEAFCCAIRCYEHSVMPYKDQMNARQFFTNLRGPFSNLDLDLPQCRPGLIRT